MDSIAEITGLVEKLEEEERLLVLEIVKKFLHFEIPTKEELLYMQLAREEYAKGETGSWDDIN